MTSADAKKFFGQLRRLDRAIRRKRNQLQELRLSLLPSGIRYDKDRVQSSPRDAMAEVMAEIDAISRDLSALQEERALAVVDIGRAVERMEGEAVKEAVVSFYVTGRKMPVIAEEMGYSERQVFRFIQRGIDQYVSECQ